MATCYGGVGDISRNEAQDNGSINNTDKIDNKDNYQDKELDNNAPRHMPAIQQLAHQVEQLR